MTGRTVIYVPIERVHFHMIDYPLSYTCPESKSDHPVIVSLPHNKISSAEKNNNFLVAN